MQAIKFLIEFSIYMLKDIIGKNQKKQPKLILEDKSNLQNIQKKNEESKYELKETSIQDSEKKDPLVKYFADVIEALTGLFITLDLKTASTFLKGTGLLSYTLQEIEGKSYNDMIHKKQESEDEKLLIQSLLKSNSAKIENLENAVGYKFKNREIALKSLFNKGFKEDISNNVFSYAPDLQQSAPNI